MTTPFTFTCSWKSMPFPSFPLLSGNSHVAHEMVLLGNKFVFQIDDQSSIKTCWWMVDDKQVFGHMNVSEIKILVDKEMGNYVKICLVVALIIIGSILLINPLAKPNPSHGNVSYQLVPNCMNWINVHHFTTRYFYISIVVVFYIFVEPHTWGLFNDTERAEVSYYDKLTNKTN